MESNLKLVWGPREVGTLTFACYMGADPALTSTPQKYQQILAHPKQEYCSTVWDPKCITNPKDGNKPSHRLVDQLEMVQRRAARWVTGRYHNTSSVSEMLRSLDWRSLEQRRVNSRLSMLFKIRHHLVAIDEESYVRYWKKRTSIPPVESRQRLNTFLFLSQDSNTVEPTSKFVLVNQKFW